HAGSVVEAVDADVDLRIGPVDEVAVHPDLLGLLHRALLCLAGRRTGFYPSPPPSNTRAAVNRLSSSGPSEAMCEGVPAPTQTTSWASSERSMSVADTARCGNGATPPGSKPVACRTSSAVATRTSVTPSAAATSRSSARRSPGTSASTYAPSHTRTTVLTICERSHPTAR